MYELKEEFVPVPDILRTSLREVFIMPKKDALQKGGEAMSVRSAPPKWEKWVFSELLARKNGAHKLAYIAVMTALCVVANTLFEFKLADVQFSLTIALSAITGILIGAFSGCIACFLGDLVGFLANSGGFIYMPWVGISMGLTAFLSGVFVTVMKGNGKRWFLFVKLALVCLVNFFVCTVAINTTAFWLLYSKVDYWTYLVTRLFVQGQIWNSLFNFLLIFLAVPALKEVKPLKVKIA